MRLPLSLLIAGALLASSAAARAAGPTPAEEWPTYGHDYGDSRHSPLTQITPANVTQLKPVWTYHLRPEGESAATPPRRFASSEDTPLVVHGVMYISSPYDQVVALDAETGKPLWKYKTPDGDPPATRGVAYWPGHDGARSEILFGTRRGLLIAVYADDGTPVPSFGQNGVLDLKTPEVMQGFPKAFFGVTSAPTIYKDIIITGSRVQEIPAQGANGRVRAFDVRTGKELWHFNGVPQPGERFHDTWVGDSWVKRSGVNVWTDVILDPQRGIAYLPFAAPTFDQYGGDRKGKSLYSNTLVAVKADTGQYLWHFQVVHQDLWDYDLPLTTLMDVKKDGKTIPSIAVMSKAAVLLILNRVTGKPVWPIRETPVPTDTDLIGETPSPTQPMSVFPPLARTSWTMADIATVTPEHKAACEKLIKDMGIVPGKFFQPQRADSAVARFPGSWGGIDWSHAAFDPASGYYIVNSSDMGSPEAMVRKPDGTYDMRDGYVWFWDKTTHLPCNQPPWGSLYAVDVNHGKIVWKKTLGVTDGLPDPNTGRPNVGGPITTASGLIFIGGTDDKRLRAFDTKTGQELWTYMLPASIYGTPLTYEGKNGKQYVAAVVTGGFWGDPASADDVSAFALP